MPFDSVCMNEECIKNERAFFQYDHQNQHISNNHTVKSIHPLTFRELFKQQETSLHHNQEVDCYLYEQLINMREEALQTITNAVKVLLHELIMPNFQQELSLCRNLDRKAFLNKMSEGNYTILHYLKHFEQQNQETNFRAFIVKSINSILSQIHLQISNIKHRLINQCLNLKQFLMSKQTFIPEPALFYYPSFQRSSMDHEEDNVSQKNNRSPQIKQQDCNEYLLQNGCYAYNRQEEVQNSSESQSAEQKDAGSMAKAKPLQKQSKKIKKRRKRYTISEQIQPINPQEIIIRQCRNAQKTIQFLQQNFPQLTTLHIFNQRMTNSSALSHILKTFPKIQRITLNCNFQFEPELFENIDKSISNKLKLELKWDLRIFFTDYFAYKYFPNKPLKRQERKKKIDAELITKSLPNNNSIWVNDNQFLSRLHDLPIKFDNIVSLHYSPITKFDKFYFSYKFQQIRVLVLKNINFYESIQLFDQFVDINQHIKVIVIADCSFSFITLSKFFINMKKIKTLAKFSLTLSQKKNTAPQINPEEMCNLTNLTHLNIDRYSFKNTPEKDTSKFTRLKHLGLYECQLTSDFWNNLSPKCFSTLQYLNLGRTYIGNSAVNSLRQMNQLRYLNMDGTRIKGDVLVEIFRYMAKQSQVIIPLKYLSLQKLEGKSQIKITKQNLQEISKYIPSLCYLNIAFNENLSTYSFTDFKTLKTLAVDKDQFEKLEEIISPDVLCFKVN